MAEDSYVKAHCGHCDAVLTIDDEAPPADDDILVCAKCGKPVGRFGEVVAHLQAEAKREVDRLTMKHLGTKPKWTR